MSCRTQRFLAAFAVILVMTSAEVKAPAQVAGSTVLGAVTDPSGAIVPNAQVEVKNVATGITRSLTTNDSGLYEVPNLQPGQYLISAGAPGFGRIAQSATLTVGTEATVNLQLRVGTAESVLEVSGEAPQVSTSNSTISAVVNETTVRELPLNARDWTALASLEAGVAPVRTQKALAIGNDRPNRGLGTQLTIGGNRPQQNIYRLDGVHINDYSNGAPGSVLGGDLGVDAIQEFSVITSNAPADYGRMSGGVVNAITRSGTNAFHGSAYEFIRNSALDARNYFDPTNRVPPFKRNQFGFTAGGPIRKNKTFIFGDFEGLRQSFSQSQTVNVPSVAARSGQLSTGNVVVDPKVAPYLAIYPMPNLPGTADIGKFQFSQTQTTHQNYFTTRFDNRFSDHDALSSTYMFDDSSTTAPDTLNVVLLGNKARRQLVTLEETHTFTSNVLNSVRGGLSRVVSIAPINLSAINPVGKDPALGFLPGHNVGTLNVAGLQLFNGGLGGAGEYDFHFNSAQVYDDAFWNKGRHSIRFGGSFERILANQIGRANPNGLFLFGSLANFLTNKPAQFTTAVPGLITPRDMRQSVVGLYIHDDYRIRPTLMLNVGLRYEIASVPTETAGRLTALRSITDATPHLGSPYFSNPTLRNFEPKVGFSWDPFGTGKTAVRGAFGIYDVLPLTYEFEILSILSAPFFEQGNVSGLPAGTFPTGAFPLLTPNRLRYAFIEPSPSRNYVMQWNFNLQRELIKNLTATISYVGSHGVHQPFRADDINIVLPTLTAQGYVWPCGAAISPTGECTKPGTGTRLNPNIGQISGLWWNNSSVYHAMQLHLAKRLSRGFQINGSYTWSKSIDAGSSTVAGDAFSNSVSSLLFFDPKTRRAVSDFDARHVLTVSYSWTLPSSSAENPIAHWLTNGWELGGIYQASSGLPFTPVVAGDPLGMLSNDTFQYVDKVSGSGCSSPVNPGKVAYVKTSCFAFPTPSNRLGSAGRNSIVGPGLSDFDFSIFKNNRFRRLSETFNLQFRAECFNILNHTNFLPPLGNRTLFTSGTPGTGAPGTLIGTAGQLQVTSTSSRQMQFAVKIMW